MPQIPLYNKGLGATLDQKSVGYQKASIEAATATGQALSDFAKSAGDIAYKFGMLEKKAETERISNEEETRLTAELDDFNMNNKDTDTTVFATNFDNFKKKKMAEAEKNMAGLTQQQKESVRTNLNNLFSTKLASGKRQAFDKGQFVRAGAAKDAIGNFEVQLGSMSKSDPLYQPTYDKAITKINDAIASGLNTGYTEETFAAAVLGRDYSKRIEAASSPAEAAAIREQAAKDTNLAPGQYEKIAKLANARENASEVELYDMYAGDIAANYDTSSKQELDLAADNLNKGKPFTIGGKTYDPEGDNVSRVNQIKLAGVISGLAKEKFDEVGNNVVGTLSNAIGSGNTENLLTGAANLYDKQSMDSRGLNEDDVDGLVVEAAQQAVDKVVTQVKSGDITNVQELIGNLEAAEALLKTDSSGRGALSARIGGVGDSADTILKAAADVRDTIRKSVNTAANLSTAVSFAKAGKLPLIDQSEITDKQMTAVVAQSLIGKDGNPLPLSQQFALLESNDAEHKMYSQSLGQGRALGLAGGFVTTDINVPDQIKGDAVETTEAFKTVEQNVMLYQAMSAYPNVLEKHTNEDDKEFYDAVISRLGYESLEMAVNNVAQANRLDIDVKPKMKAIDAEVEKISGSADQAFWFTKMFSDRPTKVLNSSYVTSELKRRTEQRIKLGADPKDALAAASEDMKRTHVFVRGSFIKLDKSMPANMSELSDAAVDRAFAMHPDALSGLEADEISLIQWGSPNSWALALNGAQPVEDERGNAIIFSTSQLNEMVNKDAEKLETARMKEFNRAAQAKSDAIMNYEDFATPEDMQLIQSGQGMYDGPSLSQYLGEAFSTTANDYTQPPEEMQQSSMFSAMSKSQASGFGGRPQSRPRKTIYDR
jgi:hypothetical protein